EGGNRPPLRLTGLDRPPPGQSAVARPIPAVVYSPTPSTVGRADSSNGEEKKALAACETWWSENRMRSAGTRNDLRIKPLIQSFSLNELIIASRKTRHDLG